jgi:hypothetical protein
MDADSCFYSYPRSSAFIRGSVFRLRCHGGMTVPPNEWAADTRGWKRIFASLYIHVHPRSFAALPFGFGVTAA